MISPLTPRWVVRDRGVPLETDNTTTLFLRSIHWSPSIRFWCPVTSGKRNEVTCRHFSCPSGFLLQFPSSTMCAKRWSSISKVGRSHQHLRLTSKMCGDRSFEFHCFTVLCTYGQQKLIWLLYLFFLHFTLVSSKIHDWRCCCGRIRTWWTIVYESKCWFSSNRR